MICQVLQNLEYSSTGIITKTEVIKAIKDAAKENHIVLSTPQVAATVESFFSLADNSGSMTRSQLREAMASNISELKDLNEKEPLYI